IVNRETSLIDN
ncbi:hypothetical protein VCHC17A1_3963B, partial [Vibrio cholerae HC-17A1]